MLWGIGVCVYVIVVWCWSVRGGMGGGLQRPRLRECLDEMI